MRRKGQILIDEAEHDNIRNVVFKPGMMTPMQLQTIFTNFCGRLFNFDSMIKRATVSINQRQRYKFPIPIRIVVLLLFLFSAMRLR